MRKAALHGCDIVSKTSTSVNLRMRVLDLLRVTDTAQCGYDMRTVLYASAVSTCIEDSVSDHSCCASLSRAGNSNLCMSEML